MDKFVTKTPRDQTEPENQPAAKKQKVDKKEANKTYDATKRNRTVQSDWFTEFPWLIEKDQTLYCNVCRSVYGPLVIHRLPQCYAKCGKGAFVVGSKSLKHDGLEKHNKSDNHKYAAKVKKAREEEKGESDIEKGLRKQLGDNFDKLKNLFHDAHAIAKKCRPLSDFEWHCQLNLVKKQDIGVTYHNRKSCQEFIVAMAEMARELKVEAKLKIAKFVTLMADGTTDISVIEQEIVYLYFAILGRRYCFFVGIIAAERGTAAGVFEAIMKALVFKNTDLETILKKLVAFAADTASVNVGEENGVIALLRDNVNSKIAMIKCMNHRIELAWKDALKMSNLFKLVVKVLGMLFKIYNKSNKQRQGLKDCFHKRGMKECMPAKVGGTRWMAHTQKGLQKFLKGRKGFTDHMTQVNLKLLPSHYF